MGIETQLGDFWWVLPLGAFIGSILAMLRGYRRPRRDDATIRGAAIIDSAHAVDLVVEVRRLAVAAEKIADQLERDATNDRMRAEIASAIAAELEKIKRGLKP